MDNKTLSPAIIVKKRETFISKYNAEVAKCNKSAWSLAKVVFSTINDTAFSEVFGNLKKYAEALNVSPASITHLSKAYISREFVRKNSASLPDFDVENIDNMTTSQWQEISAISDTDVLSFIDAKNVRTTDTVKALREKVNEYKLIGTIENEDDTEEADNEPEVVGETTADEVDDMDGVMTIGFDGDTIFVTNPVIIEKILKLAKSDK